MFLAKVKMVLSITFGPEKVNARTSPNLSNEPDMTSENQIAPISKLPNSEVAEIHRQDFLLTEQWSFLGSSCLYWHYACLAGVAEANPIIQTTQILVSITLLVFEL